ncbi:MAG: NAD(P)-dependent oxidoreductase [Candidatus Nomurabacteria bacterium]|jgi:dTDP-4-dehydrorhamnose 3,5-epimerase|nr:NAD(P)-dependent oxidoreductase [Candidatus Nomurabacteria bacterium]
MVIKDSEVLIIGGGQLGSELKRTYPDARLIDYPEIDISDRQSVREIDTDGIRLIVNAAAWTDVDGAEKLENQSKVHAINSDGAGFLATEAYLTDAILVHISSDYVFDGTQKNHLEDEPFSHINVYGMTKASGDLHVTVLADQYYILRTSWVVGPGGTGNFAKTMYNLAQRGVKPSVVNDQFGRLTFTSELVRAIRFLVENDAPFGTYNVSNSGPIKSWAEIAGDVFELADRSRSDVIGVSTEDYFKDKPETAKRPRNSDLNLSKIQSLGFESHDYESELKSYIESLISAEKEK